MILFVVGILLILAAVWLFLIATRRGGERRMEALRRFRYAHRGLYDKAAGIPENSLPAFARAVARGYGVELDVHLLADGVLAVFHDSDLARMTGREGVLEDLCAENLQGCSLDGTGERIPQFSEVLALFAGTKLPIIVELKPHGGNCAALCARTVEELEKFDVLYCVESFDPRCVRWFKKNRPEITRGQLSQDYGARRGRVGKLTGFAMTKLLSNALTRPDFIAYRYEDRRAAPLRLSRRLFSAQLVYWTVRTQQELATAEREGALVIFEGFIPR